MEETMLEVSQGTTISAQIPQCKAILLGLELTLPHDHRQKQDDVQSQPNLAAKASVQLMINCLAHALDSLPTSSRHEYGLNQNVPAEGGATRPSTESSVSNDGDLSTNDGSAATNTTSSTGNSVKMVDPRSYQPPKMSLISLQAIIDGKRALKSISHRDAALAPADTGSSDWRPPFATPDPDSSSDPNACELSEAPCAKFFPIVPRITIASCENKVHAGIDRTTDDLYESCSDTDGSKSSCGSNRPEHRSTTRTRSQFNRPQPGRSHTSSTTHSYVPYRPNQNQSSANQAKQDKPEWYQMLISPVHFEPGQIWPLAHDITFSTANVARGRFFPAEADLLKAAQFHPENILPRQSFSFLISRTLSCEGLTRLIPALRETLQTLSMGWSEVLKPRDVSFLVAYTTIEDNIATVNYFKLEIVKLPFSATEFGLVFCSSIAASSSARKTSEHSRVGQIRAAAATKRAVKNCLRTTLASVCARRRTAAAAAAESVFVPGPAKLLPPLPPSTNLPVQPLPLPPVPPPPSPSPSPPPQPQPTPLKRSTAAKLDANPPFVRRASNSDPRPTAAAASQRGEATSPLPLPLSTAPRSNGNIFSTRNSW